MVPMSSACATISSYQRRRIVARSLAVFAAQAGKAAWAAATAASVSFAPSEGTVPSGSPLAGFETATVLPSGASTQAPST